jgi:hypothetical protein
MFTSKCCGSCYIFSEFAGKCLTFSRDRVSDCSEPMHVTSFEERGSAIPGYHSGEGRGVCLLGCNVVWTPALKVETVCSSEILVPTYKSIRRYNLEEKHQPLEARFLEGIMVEKTRISKGNILISEALKLLPLARQKSDWTRCRHQNFSVVLTVEKRRGSSGTSL